MLRDDEESFCPNKLWVIQGQLLYSRPTILFPTSRVVRRLFMELVIRAV